MKWLISFALEPDRIWTSRLSFYTYVQAPLEHRKSIAISTQRKEQKQNELEIAWVNSN